MWRVVLTPRARRQLDALDRKQMQRIAARLQEVADDPLAARNVKALQGGGFRLRVGDFRVLYELIEEEIVVLVVEVGHRREVYRRR